MADPELEEDDKPLDPAVERVRQKLVRFMTVNLAILFAAIMVVVGALTYKRVFLAPKPAVDQGALAGNGSRVPSGPEIAGEIVLPQGARILLQSLADGKALLAVEAADGGRSLVYYDLETGRTLGRYRVKEQ